MCKISEGEFSEHSTLDCIFDEWANITPGSIVSHKSKTSFVKVTQNTLTAAIDQVMSPSLNSKAPPTVQNTPGKLINWSLMSSWTKNPKTKQNRSLSFSLLYLEAVLGFLIKVRFSGCSNSWQDITAHLHTFVSVAPHIQLWVISEYQNQWGL